MALSSVRIYSSLKPRTASLIAYSAVQSRSPTLLDYNLFRFKGGFVSSSGSGSSRLRAGVGDKGERTEDHPLVRDSVDNVDDKMVITQIFQSIISNYYFNVN